MSHTANREIEEIEKTFLLVTQSAFLRREGRTTDTLGRTILMCKRAD